MARYCKFIDRRDLDGWELAGWKALHHYAHRSDEIESIMIGWFSEAPPECPTPTN